MNHTGTGSGFRPHRLVGGLIVSAAFVLAVLLMVQCWIYLTVNVNSRLDTSSGAILLIDTPGDSAGRYRLLQSGLSAAGVVSGTCLLTEEAGTGIAAGGGQLQDAVSALARTAGCAEAQVWLIVHGNTSAEVWNSACALRSFAGLIMIAPQNLDSLSLSRIQKWPDGRLLAIYSGETTADGQINQTERRFFETLTGEDATLFSGYQKGTGQPVQYTTADGKVWLGLYPALTADWALLSPRVLPDVAGWLAGWAPDELMAGRLRRAAGILVDLPFKIILTGLVLLAVLTILNLFLIRVRRPDDQFFQRGPDPQTVDRSAIHWLVELLIWLPAGVLAVGIGYLADRLSSGQISTIFISLAVLPGCRGWIWLLVSLARKHRQKQARIISAGPVNLFRSVRLSAGTLCLPGMAAPLLLLVLAGIWSWLSFGSIMPQLGYWALLPILLVLNWPAGLAGSSGHAGANLAAGMQPVPGIRLSVWQHLPFLLLPVLAGVLLGWAGLAAFLLLLVIQFWSTGLGKAATLVSRRPAIGSLFQSAAYVLGILMPPLLGIPTLFQGLFH